MEQEQEFIRQLRFRYVGMTGAVGSGNGRAFNGPNNPHTHALVTWSVDWARSAWDANNWAFEQGLFRVRQFAVPFESVELAEGQPMLFGATFRVADAWLGRFAEMFMEPRLPGVSQLKPELAKADQAKWHGQIEGL